MTIDEGTVIEMRWFTQGDPIVPLSTGEVVVPVLRRKGEEFYLDVC
jgi:hypothetical protein